MAAPQSSTSCSLTLCVFICLCMRREQRLAYDRARHLADRDQRLARQRARRLANPDVVRAQDRAAYWRNRDRKIVQMRASYLAHRDERLAKREAYRLANGDLIRQQKKAYWAANREREVARVRAYHKAHKDELLARHRVYYRAKRDELLQRKKAYWAANRESLVAKHKIWARAHPDVERYHRQRKRARKLNAPVNDFTIAQWQDMQEHYNHRCAYCGKRAKGHLTQDHITPLSKGGSHTLSNIIPACRSCNSKKHTGPPLAPVQPLLLPIA